MTEILHIIFTGRNEVVAKVMFLHVCVILFTGGVSGEPPPRDQADPPGRERTPGTKEKPPPQDQGEPPRDQADPTPWQGEPPPPGRETAAYGQWAAGTHPTGMHSCLHYVHRTLNFSEQHAFQFSLTGTTHLIRFVEEIFYACSQTSDNTKRVTKNIQTQYKNIHLLDSLLRVVSYYFTS